jgi:hypothetical protein
VAMRVWDIHRYILVKEKHQEKGVAVDGCEV